MSASIDRFARQADLVPRDKLAELAVTIVGVGAIGRQVALQLAALGVRRMQLVDFDQVELTNVTTQGYLHENVGMAKVNATASAVWQIDPQIDLALIEDRYRPQVPPGDALFCCVDSIEARAAIWRSAGRRVQFWADSRMLGEVMRILAVADKDGRDHYSTTLFGAAEAQAGSCTSRGVIYTAAIAAGLLVHQFTRWLRGLPAERDLVLNLLASELTVA
jgi:sulfur carrier protein ThiS adenylyltransferase